MTLGAVLRSESLYKADLADICDVHISTTTNQEPTPYHIVILCVGEGKQNNDKDVFGRIIRHKDPRLCGVGALAFYLMLRFHLTEEPKLFDFSDNKTWFNVKLMRKMPTGKKERNRNVEENNQSKSRKFLIYNKNSCIYKSNLIYIYVITTFLMLYTKKYFNLFSFQVSFKSLLDKEDDMLMQLKWFWQIY